MKWCIAILAITLMFGGLVLNGSFAQCVNQCMDVTQQFGEDASGDDFCHQFTAPTALYLFDPSNTGSTATADPTGITIQRARTVNGNCCTATCQAPSTVNSFSCSAIAWSDWPQRRCSTGS